MLYKVVRAIVKRFYHTRFKVTVIGEERIPDSGPVLICSNHMSEFDPPLVAISTKREMSFFAKSELFKIPLLGNLIGRLNAIPVDRGKGDRQALKKSVEAMKDDTMLLLSPKGSQTKDRKLQYLHQGARIMAVKGGAKVVPAAIK